MKTENVQEQTTGLPSYTINTKRYECRYLMQISNEWRGIEKLSTRFKYLY